MRTFTTGVCGKSIPIRLFSLLFVLLLGTSLYGQPFIHDPSTTIQNTDGRYWHFGTGTGHGVYTISSTVGTFTNYRTEANPIPSGYPSWINSYVSGFTGNMWAPDIIKVGSTYWLYYACAGSGAPAAIGLMMATNLSGPWSDKGMVVAGNNAIDPSLMIDGSSIWMAWGNWQSGIDACRLNTTTGKKLNSSTYHLLSGQVEGPCILKHGSYYYLFFQRGLCCNGVNSTYYVCVMRSTTMTGGFTGERVFLPNKSGRIIGPGHIGYGAGVLSYHFYDGNDNGNAKLASTTLSWSSDWPVAGSFKSETEIVDEANTNGSVEVYPNPSNGNFTISGLKIESTITVMDLQGQQLYNNIVGQSDKVEVTANLKPGTYILRVENVKGATIKKLIVQ